MDIVSQKQPGDPCEWMVLQSKQITSIDSRIPALGKFLSEPKSMLLFPLLS